MTAHISEYVAQVNQVALFLKKYVTTSPRIAIQPCTRLGSMQSPGLSGIANINDPERMPPIVFGGIIETAVAEHQIELLIVEKNGRITPTYF